MQFSGHGCGLTWVCIPTENISWEKMGRCKLLATGKVPGSQMYLSLSTFLI